MLPHEEPDKKTQLFEKLDIVLKAVVVLTCLTGIVAVSWLCTAGRAKAQEMANAVPETIPETVIETATEMIPEIVTETVPTETWQQEAAEPETETEAEDNTSVTARAVPTIPYGYEDKTEPDAETEAAPDEDRFASADDEFSFEYRFEWPHRGVDPGWYDPGDSYEPRHFYRHEWPSDNDYNYSLPEGSIYFFWF
jgi:hypothetical protein